MKKILFALVLCGLSISFSWADEVIPRAIVNTKFRQIQQQVLGLQNQLAGKIAGRKAPTAQELDQAQRDYKKIEKMEKDLLVFQKSLRQKGGKIKVPSSLLGYFPKATPLQKKLWDLEARALGLHYRKIYLQKQLAATQKEQQKVARELRELKKKMAPPAKKKSSKK